jgi:GTP 3',8-cyclase
VGHDLKTRLRSGASDADVFELIAGVWTNRKDRYSAERLEALRSSTYDPTTHKKIEMITLGG